MSKHTVKQVSVTKGVGDLEGATAEQVILYKARVSSNRDNKLSNPKLLKWLLEQKPPHISPFQMAYMGLEIKCPLDVAAQFKRHWSMAIAEPLDVQEFSMRYAEAGEFEDLEFRTQGSTNRQVSEDEHPQSEYFRKKNEDLLKQTIELYREEIDAGVAKECARRKLPVYTMTGFFVNGSARSWISYIMQRNHEHAQKEHRLLAIDIQKIFEKEFPYISSIVKGWQNV